MLDELINDLAAKTGLSQDQARTAVTTVLDFLKQRLPAPLAEGVQMLIAREGGGAAEAAGAAAGAGGGENLIGEAESLLGGLFKG